MHRKKAKKLIKEQGEEDIESMIAAFQEQDRLQNQVIEEKCPPPSRRCNLSLTPHPDKDELVMFGGEYFNGNKTFVYNDLLFYKILTNEWVQLTTPNAPPPRCSHQTVALRQGGGQLWVFGGEFASPTQSQFYHYKDLWVFHFKTKHWDRIKTPGGPSARSGHRMVNYKKLLIVFGGFHDNIRDYKYYNDVHAFNTETYTWSKLETTGTPPSPRSGCMTALCHDRGTVFIYGGYSKERVKKDVDVGKTHTDMFMLAPDGKNEKQDPAPTKWKWTQVKQSGLRPSARCGCSMAVTSASNAVVFGGVFDEEEDEENLSGRFFNDLYDLEMDKGKWHEVDLLGKKEVGEKKRRRKRKEKQIDSEAGDADKEESAEDGSSDGMEEDIEKLKVTDSPSETMETTNESTTAAPPGVVHTDSVFTVTIGPQGGSSMRSVEGGDGCVCSAPFVPRARMNSMLAVKNGVLYMYGGLYEEGDKQLTLSDIYSLDLRKLDEWHTLISDDTARQEWVESESSSDEDDEEEIKGAVGGDEKIEDTDDEDDDDDDDEAMEAEDELPPVVTSGESAKDYFSRNHDFWMQEADAVATKEGLSVTGKQLKKAALKMAEEFFEKPGQ
ncbi:Kelch domain-containing protein 4 [Lamellibrachia satsuma]|nr:Kelch domain-containing protein 4 [Lamellibrachia satsuma]